MNRTDRLLAIVLELQAKGWQRAEDLAQTFEISKRTINHGLQALSEMLGKPLRQGEFGGMPHDFFPADEEGVAGAVVLNLNYRPGKTGPVL